MNKRLFVTLSMAGLAMVAFGARKPKAAIKSSVKTVAIKQPTFTEWHDLQVNEINRLLSLFIRKQSRALHFPDNIIKIQGQNSLTEFVFTKGHTKAFGMRVLNGDHSIRV